MLRVLPAFSESPISQGQDSLLFTTYVCVDTHIFSRHPYPLLFMEKAGKGFGKVCQKDEKKKTTMKAKNYYVFICRGAGLADGSRPVKEHKLVFARTEGLLSEQVSQAAAGWLIGDPC